MIVQVMSESNCSWASDVHFAMPVAGYTFVLISPSSISCGTTRLQRSANVDNCAKHTLVTSCPQSPVCLPVWSFPFLELVPCIPISLLPIALPSTISFTSSGILSCSVTLINCRKDALHSFGPASSGFHRLLDARCILDALGLISIRERLRGIHLTIRDSELSNRDAHTRRSAHGKPMLRQRQPDQLLPFMRQ